jgi:hypothetical protein
MYLIVVSFIVVSLSIPITETHSTDAVICGVHLPANAVLYYDDNGNLVGAKVDDPNTPEVIEPDNPFHAEDHLPEVKYRRNGLGIDVDFIQGGVTISTRHIDHDDMVSHFGSAEMVEAILQQLDDLESRTVASCSDKTGPIAIPCDTPGPIGPICYWRLDKAFMMPEIWTDVAEIYSAAGLENHLRLKMSTGARHVRSISGGPLTYGEQKSFTVWSVSDFYCSDGQTRTIEYLFDYTYEHWSWCTIGGCPLGETWENWYPSKFYGSSGRMRSPYPDANRTKSSSDDTLTLNPMAGNKAVPYDGIEMKEFGYEWGAKLNGSWKSYGGSVPIFSFSDITGLYSVSEVVYEFYNPTNYYRQWEVYEWDSNIGTSRGWVMSFRPRVGGDSMTVVLQGQVPLHPVFLVTVVTISITVTLVGIAIIYLRRRLKFRTTIE